MTLGSEHEVKTGPEAAADSRTLYVVEKKIELATSSTGQEYLDSLREGMGKKWVKDPHITILNAVQTGIIFNEYEMDPNDPDVVEWFEGVIAARAEQANGGRKSSRLGAAEADVFPDEDLRYYVGFQLDEQGVLQIQAEAEDLFKHFGVEAAEGGEKPRVSILEADSEQYAEYLTNNLNTVLGDTVEIVAPNELEAVPYSPYRPY